MFLFRDRLEVFFADGGPRGIGHDGSKEPAEMKRVVVDAAHVMVSCIARLLVLEHGEDVVGLRVE